MTANTTHRTGCPAPGGYGHGVEPCICGAANTLLPTGALSATPQADSQSAPANTKQIAECYGDCPTDSKTCANPCKFEGRAVLARWGAQPAPAASPVPLTDEQLWANDEIMSLNADLGWHMDTIRMFARVIERAHGITKGA